MDVYLVDGTYELFRHFFALPPHVAKDGREVSAARGVVGSMVGMLEGGATHVGVATDKVIESFRNDLWPSYKRGEGIDMRLLSQFPILEDGIEALGMKLYAMVEFEADDALGAVAKSAAADPNVGLVYICTPDKDMAQCVIDHKVVQLDRRKRQVTDVEGVIAKFGVRPESIPDYLALVGDSADGFPGLPGWGAKAAAAVLAKYIHLEAIPDDGTAWGVNAASAGNLGRTLARERDRALLFRELA